MPSRFDREAFFAEMQRILKPGATLAIWTNNRPHVTKPEEAVPIFEDVILKALAPYWDPRSAIAQQGHEGRSSFPLSFAALLI